MTDPRPEWVKAGARAAEVAYAEVDGDDIWTILSAAVIDAVEDKIRADERERWGLGWIATANMVSAMTAAEKHAEAVAARLVEVICEDVALDRAVIESALRAQIAADIEALPCIIMDCSELAMNHRHAVRTDDAARIARGE